MAYSRQDSPCSQQLTCTNVSHVVVRVSVFPQNHPEVERCREHKARMSIPILTSEGHKLEMPIAVPCLFT